MDFDKTLSNIIDGYELQYGIIYGNENIVFIKCGAGGTIPGYEDRYLKLAHNLHKRSGATVICSAYPYPSDDFLLEYDEEIINKLITKFKSSYTLKFIGVSRGAYIGLTYLSKRFYFTQMLLVNMPLMINYHKSIDRLSELLNTKILFVYGDQDPSVTYIPYLKLHHNNVMIINGADHNFKGMLDEFVALAELL